jgi:hypothetical protein
LVQRIEMPSLRGRVDHMDVDVEGGRLFVAALGADTPEVVDLKAGKRIGRIGGLHEPYGVACWAGFQSVECRRHAGGSAAPGEGWKRSSRCGPEARRITRRRAAPAPDIGGRSRQSSKPSLAYSPEFVKLVDRFIHLASELAGVPAPADRVIVTNGGRFADKHPIEQIPNPRDTG